MMVTVNGRGSRRSMTIIDMINDPSLFGPWFKNRKSWSAWLVFLSALFGLPMTSEQVKLYQECTARSEPPIAAAREGYLIVGRRGGKSLMLALLAVYIAAFVDHRRHLAPGERATIMIIAKDRRQARNTMRYIRSMLTRIAMLAPMIQREDAESFDLDNETTIEVHTASFTSTRGYAIAAALCDEAAFWPSDDSAEPDYEIIAALRPGMAQFPDALLMVASSPYARRGVLWDAYRKHFGKDEERALVWKAPTKLMNPTISQAFIDSETERDAASAAAEYGAEFRSDIESFVSLDVVQACIARGVYERPYQSGSRYCGFTDPSGGSSDSFTLAIAHRDADSLILDCVREVRPPFSPESVCMEFAGLLKSYRISKVTGDRYAGEWPREQFRKYGITYEPAAQRKSDLYRDTLPLLNSRRVDLLDSQRLVNQLVGLERKTSRGGRDSVDHPPGGHDDVANCVAGVITAIAKPEQRMRMFAVGCGLWCEIDLKTGRPIRQDPLPRGHLTRDEGGNIVLRAALGSNDCEPGRTDESGGFHPTHRSRSGAMRGRY